MYQCFVVCPFGTAAEELDGLYKNIFSAVEARCAAAGKPTTIVDARQTAPFGNVQRTTQEAIDKADAVIVVLMADKPNIYLELAWAHAFWHRPILLKRRGYPMPSDISDAIYVEYTEEAASGRDAPGAEALADLLTRHVLNTAGMPVRENQFGHLHPTILAVGAARVYNRFSAISVEDWSMMMQSAEKRITVASPKLSTILKQNFDWVSADAREEMPLTSLLLRKALEGVSVTLIHYDADNYSLGHMRAMRDENALQVERADIRDAADRWYTIQHSFREAVRRRRRSSKPGPTLREDGFRVISLSQRHLPYRVTMSEKRALVTLRFYTEPLNSGVCIDVPAPSGPEGSSPPGRYNLTFYDQVKRELEFLVQENAQASELSYRQWEIAKFGR